MALQTIIVDDEKKGRQALKQMLQLLELPVELMAEARGVEDAIAAIDQLEPDLVFLDIRLGKGTGFDVLEGLKHRDFHLIFVTAYDEYALKAFRYAAVDYLTKPIDPDQLEEAVERILALEGSKDIGQKLEALLQNRKSLERLALHDAQGINLVPVKDIIYCQAQNNYTEFQVEGRKSILVSKTLKEYEELLQGEGFFRVHQSYLINLAKVTQFIKQDGGYVVMSDGAQIGVARRKKEELLKHFG